MRVVCVFLLAWGCARSLPVADTGISNADEALDFEESPKLINEIKRLDKLVPLSADRVRNEENLTSNKSRQKMPSITVGANARRVKLSSEELEPSTKKFTVKLPCATDDGSCAGTEVIEFVLLHRSGVHDTRER